MVSQLCGWLPNEIGGIYCVYLDNPYISPYVPIYFGNLSIDKSYNTYNPKKYDEKSARWGIDFVDNLAKLKFQEAIKDIRKVRQPFENKIFNDLEKIENSALKKHKRSVKSAKKFLTKYSNGLMKEVVSMYLKLRNELIVKYTNNNE
jgi:dipeptidase